MKKGSVLISVIVMLGLFSLLSLFLVKIVYNNYESSILVLAKEQAFFLAEAGIENGKVEIVHNPSWFTDPPYFASDNAEWLIRYAHGHQDNLGDGAFKIVREKGKNVLYSVGYKGKGVAVLKIVFSTAPYKTLSWEEL